MTSQTTRLCFVRHGETDWNADQRMQGQRDLPLNADGLKQAEWAGPCFSGKTIAAIYSSDLLRARQTAKPIAEALKLPVTLLPALRERNFGRCEGLVGSEIVNIYPDDARALRVRDANYVLPGGESLRQVQQRVLDCIDRLARENAGQIIVVVTHGGVLDLIYRRACHMTLEQPRNFEIPNTGFNWVSICDNQWHIEQWADIAHLGERGAIKVLSNY